MFKQNKNPLDSSLFDPADYRTVLISLWTISSLGNWISEDGIAFLERPIEEETQLLDGFLEVSLKTVKFRVF